MLIVTWWLLIKGKPLDQAEKLWMLQIWRVQAKDLDSLESLWIKPKKNNFCKNKFEMKAQQVDFCTPH